jgi:hypothetical protein
VPGGRRWASGAPVIEWRLAGRSSSSRFSVAFTKVSARCCRYGATWQIRHSWLTNWSPGQTCHKPLGIRPFKLTSGGVIKAKTDRAHRPVAKSISVSNWAQSFGRPRAPCGDAPLWTGSSGRSDDGLNSPCTQIPPFIQLGDQHKGAVDGSHFHRSARIAPSLGRGHSGSDRYHQ